MEYVFNKDLLKQELKRKRLSYDDFVNLLNENSIDITKDGVTWWFRNEKNKPEFEKVQIIADILNIPFSKLAIIPEEIKKDILGAKNIGFVPIVGNASCGIPIPNSYQEIENKAFCKSEIWNKDLYAVIANGDSMIPEIDDGDEVICDPNADISNGDLVHYQINGESAIKVYVKDDDIGVIEFVPFNQNGEYKTLEFRVDDDIDIRMSKVIVVNKLKLNNRAARLKAINR